MTQFEYDPQRPLQVIRRAGARLRRDITAKVLAWLAIAVTLFGGFLALIYGLVRFALWFLRALGY